MDVDRYSPDDLVGALSGPFDVRDSKLVFHQRDLARGELAALALVKALTRTLPRTGATLLGRLDPSHPRPGLGCATAGCASPCDVQNVPLPLWAGSRAVQDRARDLVRALKMSGIRRAGLRCRIICPFEMNHVLDENTSKLDLDLSAFLSVAGSIRRSTRSEPTFVCGKIGARNRYASRLGPGVRVLSESRERSEYDVPRLGRLSFVLDADSKDPLVSMASLVGKQVREVVMEAIWRHGCGLVPGLRRPSGYRDPVTAQFLERTRDAMLASGVLPDCIERTR